jgi:pyruvate/2-oxoglutarate/acetoin dehydrogenase E1 component
MHIPGLKVAIPSNGYDAKGLLKTALRDNNPVLFIESVRLYGTKTNVPDEQYYIPFGQARIVRTGTDVTLVALSGTVPEAIAAAEALQVSGISVEVVDPRTLNPFDSTTIAESVRRTGRLVITHDAYRTCGVAAEIAQRMVEEAFQYLRAPIVRVTGLDVPIPSGPLHIGVVPNKDKLVEATRTLMTGRN